MSPIAKTKSSQKQINRFREKALELGCDEDEADFDAKLVALAKSKPISESELKGKRRRISNGLSNSDNDLH